MKTRLHSMLLLGGLALTGLAGAQFQLPFKLPIPQVPLPNLTTPDLPFTPGSAVSTSFKDTLPVASWLDRLQGDATPVQGQGFNLGPGHYRFNVQSYCLHAGTYGPTQGAGYVMAPLKGDRAGVIRGILQRSANYPNIAQRDVQQLIWGIEAGTRFTDFPPEFQLRVAPLMTPADIAQTYVTLPALTAQLPQALQDALNFYGQLRQQLTKAQGDFAALERLAVLTGTPPVDPGSRNIPAGGWTAAGEGFYARSFPSQYSKTVLEVMRVAPYRLTRDKQGRITHFESGGYSVDTTYDDRPGQNQLPDGNQLHPVWRFASIRLTGPGTGQTLELQNQGYVIPPSVMGYGQVQGALPRSKAHTQLRFALYQKGLNWQARYERAKNIKDTYDDINDYRDRADRATRPLDERAIKDFTDIGHYQDGIKAATSDMGDKLSWLTDHFQRLHDAWAYAACVLGGDCTPPGEKELPEKATFDPTGIVATPGNTRSQRLGLSTRTY